MTKDDPNDFLNEMGVLGWASEAHAHSAAKSAYEAYAEAYNAKLDKDLVVMALKAADGPNARAILLAAKDRDAMRPIREYSWAK
jgi:hypothetical protein